MQGVRSSTESATESSTRTRTRSTLLLGAMATLRERPAASLGEIAAGSGISRSTLHRYYPDRRQLLAAIEELVEAEYEAAVEAAHVDEGTALEAFSRLVDELFRRLDVLAWWLRQDAEDDEELDSRIGGLITRGQVDGSIAAGLSGAWVEGLVWAGLWAANDLVVAGVHSRRDVRSMCRRSLVRAVTA